MMAGICESSKLFTLNSFGVILPSIKGISPFKESSGEGAQEGLCLCFDR